MADEPTHPLPRMIDHWWWRPGWSVGRQFYTWRLTFDDAPDVGRLGGRTWIGLAWTSSPIDGFI